MKKAALLCAMIVVTAWSVRAATYTLLNVNDSKVWTDPIWDIGSYPQAIDDHVVISNETVHGPWNGGRSIALNVGATVGVVRTLGTTTNLPWPSIDQAGATLHFHSSDGLARIIGAGMNAGSWQLAVRCRMKLLSALEVLVLSNKQTIFASSANALEGASNIYLRNRTPEVYSLVVNLGPCPGFTGEVHVEGAVSYAGETLLYSATNALVVIEPGGRIQIPSFVSNIGTRLVMRSGSTINCAVNNSINLRSPVEIHGDVTNAAWEWSPQAPFTLYGDISGTGTIHRSPFSYNASSVYSNRYLGSVSPGLGGAGTITFVGGLYTGGTAVVLGEVGDPLLLNIENGDQVIATTMDARVNLNALDVKFLDTTTPGTTNWFLQTANGFAGGAFNNIDWGIFNGYCVSNVPGMESYIGAVVVPEPAGVRFGALLWWQVRPVSRRVPRRSSCARAA